MTRIALHGAVRTGIATSVPRTVVRRIRLGIVDSHAREKDDLVERLDVASQRDAVLRAAVDVAEDRSGQDGKGAPGERLRS